jgi:hypothetical protein
VQDESAPRVVQVALQKGEVSRSRIPAELGIEVAYDDDEGGDGSEDGEEDVLRSNEIRSIAPPD